MTSNTGQTRRRWRAPTGGKRFKGNDGLEKQATLIGEPPTVLPVFFRPIFSG
jgi:hypothetical protein